MSYLPSVALLLSVLVAGTHQQDYCGNVNAETLKLAITIFRHGDRTPRATFPNDAWLSYWDPWSGIDKITQTGTKQNYDAGKWFRNCYDSFLGDTYDLRNVYIRSTDTDKALQTANAYAAAIYPPCDNQIWDDVSSNPLAGVWQPASVHTLPTSEDYLLNTRITCPAYQTVVDRRWRTQAHFNQIRSANQGLLNYIAVQAGYPTPGDLKQISSILSDWAFVVQQHGFAYPAWMNSTIINKLMAWRHLWVSAEAGNDLSVRLGAGQLVAAIQDYAQNKSLGLLSYKHIIYSAHDYDVAGLLGAYGHFYSTIPNYGATLITELHYDSSEDAYFVKVFYRNSATSDPAQLSIRNCADPCYLDDFIAALNPLRNANRATTCFA